MKLVILKSDFEAMTVISKVERKMTQLFNEIRKKTNAL